MMAALIRERMRQEGALEQVRLGRMSREDCPCIDPYQWKVARALDWQRLEPFFEVALKELVESEEREKILRERKEKWLARVDEVMELRKRWKRDAKQK